MAGVIDTILDRLTSASLAIALMAAGAWLVCRLRPSLTPSARSTIWWLVAAAALVRLAPLPPLTLEVPDAWRLGKLLPAGPAPASPPAPAIGATPPTDQVLARVPTRADDRPPERGAERLTNPFVPVTAPPGALASTAGAPFDWRTPLVVLWALVGGTLFARLATANRRLRRLADDADPVPDAIAIEVDRLASGLGLRRTPAVRVSADVQTPQVFGLFRPTVLLPSAALTTFTPRERAMTLCHELAHVRRLDLALAWAPAVMERLLFFHPGARLAAREYALAREAACDADVLQHLGEAPRDYGRLLLRLGVTRRPAALAAAQSSPSTRMLRRRLAMLNDHEPSPRARGGLWLAAALVLPLALPLSLVARQSDAPTAPPAPPARAAGPLPPTPPAPFGVAAPPAPPAPFVAAARPAPPVPFAAAAPPAPPVPFAAAGPPAPAVPFAPAAPPAPPLPARAWWAQGSGIGDGSGVGAGTGNGAGAGSGAGVGVGRGDDQAPPPPPPPPGRARTPLPPPPPPPPPAGDGLYWVDGRQGTIVLFDGDGTSVFSGSSTEVSEARRLRGGDDGPFLYYRANGKAYTSRDRALIERVRAEMREQRELGEKQGELGRLQGELGARQGALGVHQAELGMQQGAADQAMARAGHDARLHALEVALATLERERGEQSAELEAARKAMREAIATLRRGAGRSAAASQEDAARRRAETETFAAGQRELAAEQRALGQQQAELGREQAELGRRQRAAADAARQRIMQLLEEATAAGQAQPVK